MKRSLLVSLAAAGLMIPLAAAAPAAATNGGGHAGRTASTNGGGHAGRTPNASCVDTDREGTSTVALPILYSPGGAQIDTLAANKAFDFCSNTATVSGSATYVYGEYLKGSSWLHGWVNQAQFKRVIRIS